MSLITYFKATLACPQCGHQGTAWMPSKLGSRGATYAVGDCPGDDIPRADIEDAGFEIHPPAEGEPVHVLLSFTCESCDRESFADIELAAGCVRSIRAVELTPESFARLHYIDEGLYDMLETIIGAPVYTAEGVRPDLVNALAEALAAGRRWGS